MDGTHNWFITVSPGLEDVLINELSNKGLLNHYIKHDGGIEIETDFETIQKISLCSSTSESIRLRVGSFKSIYFESMKKHFIDLPWDLFIKEGDTIDFHVHCSKSSRLYHTSAIKERLFNVLFKKMNQNIYLFNPNHQLNNNSSHSSDIKVIYIRNIDDLFTCSISVSNSIYKKRYDQNKWVTDACIRETIASSIILKSKYEISNQLSSSSKFQGNRKFLLWDPFCGSGTIVTESTRNDFFNDKDELKILNETSHFEFESFPCFNSSNYELLKKEIPYSIDSFIHKNNQFFLGSDIDKKSIDISLYNRDIILKGKNLLNSSTNKEHNNISLFNHHPLINFMEGDFERIEMMIPRNEFDITIISNLPYGVRIRKNDQLEKTFSRFGKMIRRRNDIKNVFIINGSKSLLKNMNLKSPKTLLTFKNRGIPVQLLRIK